MQLERPENWEWHDHNHQVVKNGESGKEDDEHKGVDALYGWLFIFPIIPIARDGKLV